MLIQMGRTVQRLLIVEPAHRAADHGGFVVFGLDGSKTVVSPMQLDLKIAVNGARFTKSECSLYAQAQVERLTRSWMYEEAALPVLLDRALSADEDGMLRPLYVTIVMEQYF